MDQKSTKNRSKSQSTPIQNCILFSVALGTDFQWILARFLVPKSSKNYTKISPRIPSTTEHAESKNVKKTICFYSISVPSGILCNVAKSSKIDLTSIKKQLSKQCCKLDRFWNQLGSILGGFWGASWCQNLKKIDLNMYYKNDDVCSCFYVALKLNFAGFWLQLGPNLAPKTAS